MKDNSEMTREELIALGWMKNPLDKMQEKTEKQLTAVEWLVEQLDLNVFESDEDVADVIDKAKEMEESQQFSDYMRGWDDGYQNKVKNPLNDNPKSE